MDLFRGGFEPYGHLPYIRHCTENAVGGPKKKKEEFSTKIQDLPVKIMSSAQKLS